MHVFCDKASGTNLVTVSSYSQWLWWVWSRHSTLLQRMEGVLKYVLLYTCQTVTVLSSSLSLSYSLLKTFLQVMPRYVSPFILFTSLQSPPWIIGERERANLVVQLARFFDIYIDFIRARCTYRNVLNIRHMRKMQNAKNAHAHSLSAHRVLPWSGLYKSPSGFSSCWLHPWIRSAPHRTYNLHWTMGLPHQPRPATKGLALVLLRAQRPATES